MHCPFVPPAILALFFATPVAAQCPQWIPGFHGTGADRVVSALATFDDGNGPALYAAGDFGVVDDAIATRVARWDGQEWEPLASGVDREVYALVAHDDGSGPALYAGGRFITAGGTAVSHVARWNGTSWSRVGFQDFLDAPLVNALAVYDDGSGAKLYAGGHFFVSGSASVAHIARWDGISWTALGLGTNNTVTALAVHDDGTGPALFATGYFDGAGGLPATGIAKWNGSAWSPLGAGISDVGGALCSFDDGTGPALFAGGFFTSAGGVPASGIARWDGSTWSSLAGGVAGNVNALLAHDDGSGPALFAAGAFSSAGGVPASRIARWNGTGWSPLSTGASDTVLALCSFDEGPGGSGPALFASGSFATAGGELVARIARWSGGAWSALGAGGLGLHGGIGSLIEHDDGSGSALWAGGTFDFVGRTPAQNVARWNGSTWSPIPGGPEGSVLALAWHDDGSGMALYAGGDFLNAGGQLVDDLARWNGTSWSPVGGGFTGPFGNCLVTAFATWDDGTGSALYAGGFFDHAGGVPAIGLARWNGTSWSVVGGGVGPASTFPWVAQLGVSDLGGSPALYVAGRFSTAGGVPANRIARWNGTSWTALGSGITAPNALGSVSSLAFHDDGSGAALYVGGEFDRAGGNVAFNVARWNGSTWAPVGTGLDRLVADLHVHDDGTGQALYAAGMFTIAGSEQPKRVARWDGVQWSGLATGIGAAYPQSVNSLATFDDGTGGGADLYAGGSFTIAGTHVASGLAEWVSCGPPGVAFCSGDGTASPCPCGNTGTSGHGCANSVDAAGARLDASGSPSVGADTLVLNGSGMPNSSALYVQGTERDNGGLGTPIYDGLRCVGGAILRLATTSNVAGASAIPLPGAQPISVRGALPSQGGTRTYQAYYRNPAPAFCPPGTANWSNGLSIAWYP